MHGGRGDPRGRGRRGGVDRCRKNGAPGPFRGNAMLRKHSQLLLSGLFISDMLVLSASWLLAYWIRFNWDLIPIERGVPPLEPYLRILPYAVVVWAVVFKALGLYLPRRGASLIYE